MILSRTRARRENERDAGKRALGIALLLAAGCAAAPARQIPPDPWTSDLFAGGGQREVSLRGMGLGYPPWYQGPLAASEDDPVRYGDSAELLRSAHDFAFVLRQGSSFLGWFDVLEIDAEGRATLRFGKPRRRAEFRLTSGELARLQTMLALVDFFHLKKWYSAGAEDGGSWFLQVTASGKKKSVACDNHFPGELVLVSELVRKEILAPHRAAIDAAVPGPRWETGSPRDDAPPPPPEP